MSIFATSPLARVMSLVVLAVIVAWPSVMPAQVCSVNSVILTEDFSTTTYKASATAAGWDAVDGELSLPYRSNAVIGSDETLGFRAFAVTSVGDPDGDGDDDLVVLMMSPSDVDGAGHLHFASNLGMSGSDHVGWDYDGSGTAGGDHTSLGFVARQIASSDNRTAAVLISGDVDGDGDMDVLYLVNDSPQSTGALSGAILFEQTGVVSGVPTWTAFDVWGELLATPDEWPLGSPVLSWHRPASSIAQFVRYNGNLRTDLAVFSTQGTAASQYDEVFLFNAGFSTAADPITLDANVFHTHAPCTGFHDPEPLLGSAGLSTPMAGNVTGAPGCLSDPGNPSYGGTVLLLADFDGDNDFDIVTGSISETDLTYFRSNGGTSCPTALDPNPRIEATETVTFSEGGAAYGVVGDFTGDSLPDFIIGRDAESCATGDGTAFLFVNQGSDNPRFLKESIPVVNRGPDLDWMTTLDIDGDGALDVMAGTAVLDSPYDLLRSTSTDLFVTKAEATSKVLDALDNDTYGIVSVTVSSIDQALPSGDTRIRIFVSNNGGDDFTELSSDEIAGTEEHSFTTYGSDFVFRAELEADPADDLGEAEARFHPVARDSPTLDSISFTIEYVEEREYSRSGITEGIGSYKGVLYQPSFEYPGFAARMYAYDISAGLNVSGLERIDNGLTEDWEAGDVSTASNLRLLYGAYAAGGSGQPDDRLTITTTEIDAPSTAPTLQSLFGMGDAAKAKSLISFIKNGMSDSDTGRDKLYDWGHSSPVFVAEPIGDAAFFDPDGSLDYEQYRTDEASRDPTIYIGGNSGFLHAFDAADGAEKWALAPANLLEKLQRQRHTLEASIIYRHDEYVDGVVRTFDVYDEVATDWKTVLVVGQALGEGADGNNYYFTIDVTNPADPKPLWQFTDPLVHGGGSCDRSDGSDCAPSCTNSCGSYNCSDATCVSTEDDSLVISNADEQIVIEAEGFNYTNSIDGSKNWTEQSDDSNYAGFEGAGYVIGLPNSGTNCEYDGGIGSCGAVMQYHFRVDEAGTYRPHFRGWGPDGSNNSLGWLIDDGSLEWRHAPFNDQWEWIAGVGTQALQPGVHTLTVYMREDGWRLDRIVLTSGTAPTGSGPTHTCEDVCDRPVCTVSCSDNCIDPDTEAWPTCSGGQKCCEDGDADFCQPLANACGDVDTVIGQSFSPPAVGRVKIDGDDRWLAFFGSGYNNRDVVNVGRSIYAVDVFSGDLVGQWNLDDLPADSSNPSTIDNTVPGGIRLVDTVGNGYVDRLYIGDLEGRLWRIDTSSDAQVSGGMVVPATGEDYSWRACNIFDAGKLNSGGDRRWAPIITTPAAAFVNGNRPNLYFGTGGDDRAPDTEMYQFFSVRDSYGVNQCPLDSGSPNPKIQTDLTIASPQYEWVIGDGKFNTITLDDFDLANADNEGLVGERYWSDPVTLSNQLVIFVSLPGSIESVDPCELLDGQSRLFGIALQDTLINGVRKRPGQSIFPDPWLLSVSKSRTPAIFLGFKEQTVTTANAPMPGRDDKVQAVLGGLSASDKAPLEAVTMGGGGAGTVREYRNPLKVLRWREVPL